MALAVRLWVMWPRINWAASAARPSTMRETTRTVPRAAACSLGVPLPASTRKPAGTRRAHPAPGPDAGCLAWPAVLRCAAAAMAVIARHGEEPPCPAPHHPSPTSRAPDARPGSSCPPPCPLRTSARAGRRTDGPLEQQYPAVDGARRLGCGAGRPGQRTAPGRGGGRTYAQNFLLSLAARGLAGIPQTLLGVYADTVREFLGVPAELKLLFGISFGMAGPAAPVNTLRTERVPLQRSVSCMTPRESSTGSSSSARGTIRRRARRREDEVVRGGVLVRPGPARHALAALAPGEAER
ncbi:hypothetical protein QF034_000217 [Streptomyces africanus]|uniref:Nitroreductase domain-containing protein n=1 Tax=Streptomyces africanus TaxID=231024 RepID=A0ABU0QF18_9ACTN|nr:hypothetical protein [Streptomyces africanus]